MSASVAATKSRGAGSSELTFSGLVDRLVSSSADDAGTTGTTGTTGTASSLADVLGAVLEQQRPPVAARAATRTTVEVDDSDALARPLSSSSSGQEVVDLASEHLGVPYVWGGEDPSGFDCSGLIQYTYAKLGIDVPRVSRDQARAGVAVPSLDQAVPGDLVAFGSPVDHIGIYAGDGKMVVAPHTGDVVKVQTISRTPTAIRRILAPDAPSVAEAPGLADTGSNDPAAAYRTLFADAEARHGVSAELLEAVAKQESGFNPNAVSPAGAQGLMQLMPATARALKVDAFDPVAAVDGSARLLGQHLRRFGSVPLALAAYNAGPGAVERFGGVPPYRETQGYVAKIMANLSGDVTANASSASPANPSRLVSAPITLSRRTPLFSDAGTSPAASAIATLTSAPSTATVTTPTVATSSTATKAPVPVTVPQPTMVASTVLGAPGFTLPEGKPVSPAKGAWGPNTQTQVTSVGGSGTVSWLEAGLLEPASPADIAAIVSSAKGPVAKGVLKILQNATAAQLISPEFRQTLNDVNRDALGLPDAPDVIPVQPPTPTAAPSAPTAKAPATSSTGTASTGTAPTVTGSTATLARPLPPASGTTAPKG